MLVATKVQKE